MLGPAGLDFTALHSTTVLSVLTATNVSLESSSSGGHQAVPVLGTLATASTTLGQYRHGLDIHCHYTTTTNTNNNTIITTNKNKNMSLVVLVVVVVV